MAVMKKKGNKSLPPISTASLPDVIFMILFFFMVSTTMRDQELLVRYKLPEATEVQKLEKKSLVSYIHIGQPSLVMQAKFGTAPRIQLNDSYKTDQGYFGFRSRRARQAQRGRPSLDDDLPQGRPDNQNGYRNRREAGTSPCQCTKGLLRRFQVAGILNPESYRKRAEVGLQPFFMCHTDSYTASSIFKRMPATARRQGKFGPGI